MSIVRYTRKTAVLARLESAYGAEPEENWTSSDVVLVRNATFRIARDTEPRELLRPYLGGSEHMVAARRSELEFEVEFAASGVAGTPPAWGRLLRACGMSETIVAGSRVEYLPVSGGFESLTLRFNVDGMRYASRGARGSAKFLCNAYKIPVIQFKFWGFDTWAAEGNSFGATGYNYAAWQRPEVISDSNSGDIRLGGGLVGGAPSGGTLLPSQGLEVDLSNKLSHIKMLGGEAVDIVERDVMGKMTVALSPADEVAWRSEINANALTSVGFNFGTATGRRVHLHAPSVQRVDPQMRDYEGRALMETELRCLPVEGNDELRVIVR